MDKPTITFSEDEHEVLTECVKEVSSEFSITRNKEGSIFSTTARYKMLSTVPRGGDYNTVLDWQRIQVVNRMNNDYWNKGLKSPVNK